jgi:large subunit ribosomal protein L21
MDSYAIVQASGKQLWVEENKFYDFDKLPLDRGDTFSLNQILLVNKGSSVAIGKPFLDAGYSVEATVLRHLSGPKIRVYKMRPKKKTRKTFGSRPKLTRILINSISKK